ncbi:hypothetical protein CAPTEDRAFT_221687 [Capitella teleta]|uniref:RRM domain-containing protein n=1 Tax=Capitella teleta TaxID=283909 RepID=R7THK2_CAPTE|nr:hypothetical protein CAPTEDRAFT_221687 [Capitella teleta]|eukprot:ELT90590.1 hypothetical protein CAPTEDRAFT_221687 [Capitella teleta]
MSGGFRANEGRIYVGNLPPDIRNRDIEDLFYKFGKITFIDLKNKRGPPFAFVEFEDPRFHAGNSGIPLDICQKEHGFKGKKGSGYWDDHMRRSLGAGFRIHLESLIRNWISHFRI